MSTATTTTTAAPLQLLLQHPRVEAHQLLLQLPQADLMRNGAATGLELVTP